MAPGPSSFEGAVRESKEKIKIQLEENRIIFLARGKTVKKVQHPKISTQLALDIEHLLLSKHVDGFRRIKEFGGISMNRNESSASVSMPSS